MDGKYMDCPHLTTRKYTNFSGPSTPRTTHLPSIRSKRWTATAGGMLVLLVILQTGPAIAKAQPRFDSSIRGALADGHFAGSKCALSTRTRVYVDYNLVVTKFDWPDVKGEPLLIQARTGPGQRWQTIHSDWVKGNWVPGYKGQPGGVWGSVSTRLLRAAFVASHRFRLLIPSSAWTRRASTTGDGAAPYCG